VRKGLPFRTAYKIVGESVAKCIASGKTLETLSLEEYKALSDVFEPDLYEAIDLSVCVEKRISLGGTSPENVQMQVDFARKMIG
jgi:argininosuccinate lyase